ncbi:MAG: VOC family protein [Planctomycetaceae bacterium]
MPEMTSYIPGQFNWVDLSAHDMPAAVEFYGKLFGWECLEQDTGGGPHYGIFELNGRQVGGIGQMADPMKAMGIPSTWNSYVNVENIETAAAKAVELGATMTVPVMKAVDAGWLAFLLDPAGASFALWQPDRHCGAQLVNDPGSFCWNELATPDVEQAKEFYAQLFGWEYALNEQAPSTYYIIKNTGSDNGGIMQMTEEWEGVPPHWMVYFAVENADGCATRVAELGGKVCVPPFDIPIGRIAVLNDVQGATFSAFQFASTTE